MSDLIEPRCLSLALLVLLSLPLGAGTLAHEVQVRPFLQRVSPSSVHIHWETTGGTESTVEWGLTESLENSATGSASEGFGESKHHGVELTGLEPGTRYWYRTVTEDAVSQVYDFVTPALPSAEQSFRLVAVSDMQKSWAAPDKFREIIEDGVLAFVEAEFGSDLPSELAMTLVPGDLVDNGWSYDQFAHDFFAPGERLWPHVPVYPVPGNHEADSAYFFDYFNLPPNGSAGYLEHWWFLDRSNVRVIGLDSNGDYRIQEQLDWLDDVLAATCVDSDIDFVFAQLHHPFKSELWLPGETGYTGSVVERLEAFSTECGKPSIHFFGHTHGYSRGQSRDHNHLWVNVATAGGAIDYWGEYPQADYSEFVATHDDWGFVVVEIEAGEAPSFRLRRVSRGDEAVTLNNQVRDDLTIRLGNAGPDLPVALSPSGEGASPDETLFVASLYSDPDGDPHGASHWQIADSCESWEALLVDRWVQYRNEYFGQDLQAGDDLTDEVVYELDGETDYCWRVRYRDQGLGWSEWSAPVAFRTGESLLSDNLLLNPGAEDGTKHWPALEGIIESLTDGECDSVPPHSGDRLFAVGGVCTNEADFGSASQRVSVADWSKAIDADRALAHFGAWMRNYGGSDQPEFEIAAFAEAGEELARSNRHSNSTGSWDQSSDSLALPSGTRTVEFFLYGTRNAGSDNDSYFDDLELRLLIEDAPGDDDDSALGDDDDSALGDDDDNGIDGSGEACGCAVQSAGDQPLEWLGLLLLSFTGLLSRRWVSHRYHKRTA